MPIIDVEALRATVRGTAPTAGELADAYGEVFAAPPGRVWVRLRWLEADCYAENGLSIAESELPVFVTVLHARWPEGPALQAELEALTRTTAAAFGCAAERVHVQYAPPGAGRQAFGGHLV